MRGPDPASRQGRDPEQDRVQFIDGLVYINGHAVKRIQIDEIAGASEGRTTQTKRWREELPNGASYETLDLPYNLQSDNTAVFTVTDVATQRLPEAVGKCPSRHGVIDVL